MFRKHDIVAVPDGRVGMVDKSYSGSGVQVRFGPDGPVESFRKREIRFASSEDMKANGGVDFFAETHSSIGVRGAPRRGAARASSSPPVVSSVRISGIDGTGTPQEDVYARTRRVLDRDQ